MSFDNTGFVLAIAVEPLETASDSINSSKSQVVNLYNIEDTELKEKPFKSIYLASMAELTGLKFSNNGKLMFVSTNESLLMLFDAMTGNSVRRLEFPNSEGLNLEACFSPDSKYIMTGD